MKDVTSPQIVKDLAEGVGGTIEETQVLPDGSGFSIMSTPLPKDHWSTKEGYEEPPAPLLMGTDNPLREPLRQAVMAAAQYAIRAATDNGKIDDYDPDAMVQNMVIGMLGYNTPDGKSHI